MHSVGGCYSTRHVEDDAPAGRVSAQCATSPPSQSLRRIVKVVLLPTQVLVTKPLASSVAFGRATYRHCLG
jgi:hypothetical protein